ncbi:MAG: Substrate-binding region of ABC-type glycine betaine transport system [Schlesneria sp.]|nr:Substrate-binding region of ABC-type glycine betaine transport system [Schlesneria sp.]
MRPTRTSLCLIIAVLMASTSQAETKKPLVRVGSKAFTESVVLGEVLEHLIADAGGRPEHRAELGGTQVCWKALLSGDIDCYVEYTGTIQQEILSGESVRGDESMREALAKRGVTMSRHLGFNNTYALGMPEELAAKLNIRTISELAASPELPQLKMRFSDEFIERDDGWNGLRREYRLPEIAARGIDHSLAYRGLQSGSHQITDVFTTDAEIRLYNIRVLEDDRGYFPLYQAVLLSRADLQDRAPQVVQSLHRIEGLIDNAAMIDMNARAKLDRVDESRVAADFLKDKLNLSITLPGQGRSARLMQATHRLLDNLLQHLMLVSVSLIAAIIVAVPLGIISYYKPRLGRLVLNSVGIVQTLPAMAVLVFTIPILGLGAWPAIFALFLYSLLPIVRNTYTGLSDIPQHLRDSAMVLGLSPLARLRLVELPLASTSIMGGIKTAAVINVGTATIGALVGAGGFGQPILTGIRLDDFSLILQGAVPAAALAVVVQAAFGYAERWIIPAGLRVVAS